MSKARRIGTLSVQELGILALLALAFYGACLGNGYGDDAWRVTSDYQRINKQVEKGLAGIPEIFGSRYAEIKNRDGVQASYGYRPLPESSFALEWALWGQSPGRAHAINLILYLLFCAFLLHFMRRMFPELPKAAGFLAAAAFLVHPLHSEVVLALKNREAIMAAFFGLVYLLLCKRFAENGEWKIGLLALLPLQLGIWSKDDIYLFVALMPALWLFEGKPEWRALPKTLLPFLRWSIVPLAVLMSIMFAIRQTEWGSPEGRTWLGLALLLLLWAFVAHSPKRLANGTSRYAALGLYSMGLVVLNLALVDLAFGMEKTQDEFWENPLLVASMPGDALWTALKTCGFYLKMLVWPYPLSVYYGYDVLAHAKRLSLESLMGIGFVLAMASAPLWFFKLPRASRFGLLWWCVGMGLLSNAVFPMTGIVAERYVFSVSIGAFLFLGPLAARLCTTTSTPKGTWNQMAGRGAIAAVLMVFWVIDFGRCLDWADYGSLYYRDAVRNPASAKTASMYAHWLDRQRNPQASSEQRNQETDKVLHWLDRSLSVYPDASDVLNLKGNLLLEKGSPLEAAEIFAHNLQVNPDYTVSYNNLGVAYLEADQPEKAMPFVRAAIARNPNAIDPHLSAGTGHLMLGQWDSAAIVAQNGRMRFGAYSAWDILDTLARQQQVPEAYR